MAKLTEMQWAAVRAAWEYSPDLTHAAAAQAAAKRHNFEPPTKQAVQQRARNQGWTRRASLAGVNAAAHRLADRVVDENGEWVGPPAVLADKAPIPHDTAKTEAEERADSESRRAALIARHRTEWKQVAGLRQEALNRRSTDAQDAFHRLKIAKITAEITKIQQEGEAKAWGLDDYSDPASQAVAAAAAATKVASDEAFRQTVREVLGEF